MQAVGILMIKQVFYNANERRIRSSWRILMTGLFSFIGVLFCSIAIQLIFRRPLLMMLAGAPVVLGLVLGCVTVGGRLLDRRKLEDFGLHLEHRWFTDLAFGLALGLMLVTGIVAVEFAAGWSSQLGVTGVPRINTRALAECNLESSSDSGAGDFGFHVPVYKRSPVVALKCRTHVQHRASAPRASNAFRFVPFDRSPGDGKHLRSLPTRSGSHDEGTHRNASDPCSSQGNRKYVQAI
jgi:hypothetical protein